MILIYQLEIRGHAATNYRVLLTDDGYLQKKIAWGCSTIRSEATQISNQEQPNRPNRPKLCSSPWGTGLDNLLRFFYMNGLFTCTCIDVHTHTHIYIQTCTRKLSILGQQKMPYAISLIQFPAHLDLSWKENRTQTPFKWSVLISPSNTRRCQASHIQGLQSTPLVPYIRLESHVQ